MKTSGICLKKILKYTLVALFWLALWQLLSMIVGKELLLPSPITTAIALFNNIKSQKFLISVGVSILRVIIGFAAATAVGALLGFVTAKSKAAYTLLSPLIRAIRAAPVASFIVLALVWVDDDSLPAFIAFTMGMPIVWQGVLTAVKEQNVKLLEAARVFGFGEAKTFRFVTLPSVFPAFLSSAVTCLGFCWKSAVAAEVICLPRYAIGHLLYTGKNNLETADVFACTIVTVVLSLFFETLLKKLLKGVRRNENRV